MDPAVLLVEITVRRPSMADNKLRLAWSDVDMSVRDYHRRLQRTRDLASPRLRHQQVRPSSLSSLSHHPPGPRPCIPAMARPRNRPALTGLTMGGTVRRQLRLASRSASYVQGCAN